MSLPSTRFVDLTSVTSRLGPEAVRCGTEYFAQSRVGPISWDEETHRLSACVTGRRHTPYRIDLTMLVRDAAIVGLDFGACTCPMRYDCKHVVAVLLQAHSNADVPADDNWVRVLSPIADPAFDHAIHIPREQFGLRLGLALDRVDGDRLRLVAQPVRSKNRQGWTTANISWADLPYSPDHFAGQQLSTLRELYCLHQMKARRGPGYLSYDLDRKSIDLAALPGRLMWELLADATRAGLQLTHLQQELGGIDAPLEATFSVDITDIDGDLSIRSALSVEGEAVTPSCIGLLGDDGFGFAYWSPGAASDPADRLFRLARLKDPIPPALRSLVGGRRLRVPSANRVEFGTHYLPAIEGQATVVSSDSSYRAPSVVGPVLHFAVTYAPDHTVAVTAAWQYLIDDTLHEAQAAIPHSGSAQRDAGAEQVVLSAVDRVLNLSTIEGSLIADFVCTGMEAIVFLTVTVPSLRAVDSVRVSVIGDPPEFSDVSEDFGISVGTADIESSLDWFDLAVKIEIDTDTCVPIAEVIAGIARGHTHLVLADGRYFDLHSDRLTRLRELVQEARSLQESPSGPLRLSRLQSGLWAEFAALGTVDSQADRWREQVSDLLALDSVPDLPTPAGLTATLRPYQQQGFSWLSFLYDHGLGGVLADDMGLGKTVQTLAMITRVRELSSSAAPFLIVAPTSVVHNWAREAAQFAPTLSVVTAATTVAKRRTSIAEEAEGVDVLITSFSVFRLDFSEYDAVDWSGLILDEAQNVKNHQGKAYRCARSLETPFKLAITGTPMENNLMELWALLSITAPGLFPSPRKFTEDYRVPIEKEADTDRLARLRRRIRPLVLRRTKALVATDLPPKQEQTVTVDLHPAHRRLYDTVLARERQKILGLLDDFEHNRIVILRSLTLLRQLSLDAGLVEPAYSAIPSAKTEELTSQLTDIIAGGHRALVFSQFTGYLGKVRDRLSECGIGYEYLDGATRDRGTVIERFRSGSVPVFLISLKAGGVGLTLTEADYCFVLDPWWNPAAEAQAVDRAHRIGQKNTVFVNRYIARGTIEEKVMQLKMRKSALFDSVMNGGGALDGGVTAADIRDLLG